MTDDVDIKKSAELLLRGVGVSAELEFARIEGGANNRVFRVGAGGRSFLLKAYFRHPDDLRDRLKTEYSFTRFAWKSGIKALPEPVAVDYSANLAVYEFIAGRRLEPEEITEDYVNRALGFFIDLNRHRHAPEAEALGEASEAAFSLSGHLDIVAGRIERLKNISIETSIGKEAVEFVNTDMSKIWAEVDAGCREKAKKSGIDVKTELDSDSRCVSPSDFGFHNAILTPEGELRFIDFEYAGWDDPAKTVADFFCQPEIPVSLEYLESFIQGIISGVQALEIERERIKLLFPVYRIKWCCIILNPFIPIGESRVRFSGKDSDIEESKRAQLQKAKQMLERIQ